MGHTPTRGVRLISGPMLLVIVPAAVGLIAALVRRLPALSALIGSIALCAVAIWVLQTSFDEPLVLLGRPLTFSDGDRLGIVYLFIVTAVIFIGAWRSAPRWTYYPVVLFALAALAAALIVRPPLNEIYPSFVYSALFISLASALLVLALQSEQSHMTAGALRFIIFVTLALPALLLSDYTLSQFAQSPDSPDLAQATVILIGLGFTFLLALAPFHSWVPRVAREAPPISTAIILNVLFGAVWIFLLDVLHENILISSNPDIPNLVRAAGVLMAVIGGAFSWTQRDFGGLLGYAALADIGAMLYGVGIGTSTALAAAFIVLIVRSVSILLMAIGMTMARERRGDDRFFTLRGLVWQMPFAALAIIVGGLSLAGFPPFAGFAGRWGIVQQMSFTDSRAALVMLAASISVAVGVLRGLREMLSAAESDDDAAPTEGRGERIMIIVGIALCVLVGLFPGMFAQFVQAFTTAYQ